MPKIPATTRGAEIIGWGTALPERVVTNDELSLTLDTSDEWIRERTGITRRHIGGSTASLSVESATRAIAMSGLELKDIDALILATTSPDRAIPATASTVQHLLGVHCGAYDINAACSGFVYGLVTAHGLIAMGAKNVLVIGTDTLSRLTDQTDRNIAPLFGDGSGAAVLQAVDGAGQMLAWDIDSDGSAEDLLYAEIGQYMHMNGKEVFRKAVRVMVDSAQKSMAIAGVSADEISLVVPHQANIRIISAACERLGVPMERTALVLHETGNTSAASIPLALFDAADNGRINKGDILLLVGFGAGMTAASAIIRWSN